MKPIDVVSVEKIYNFFINVPLFVLQNYYDLNQFRIYLFISEKNFFRIFPDHDMLFYFN